MTLYNRYLLSLASLFGLSTAVLASYGQARLDAYLTTYILEYLITTILFVYIEPKARKLLDGFGYVLLASFLTLVVVKVIGILKGT